MASISIEESTTPKKGWMTPRRLSQMGVHAVLIVFMIVIFIPLIWTFATSFKDRTEFLTNSAALIPSTFSLVNYQYVLSQVRGLPQYLLNSVFLAVGTAVLQVLICSLAGYAFARMRFPGRDLIFALLLLSMFIPRSGGLMALYELMAFLKLRNSLVGLVLLFAASVPGAIFIMRQNFLSLPQEIEEAAVMDGANWFQVFFRIALPLATGGMIVVATLAFVGVWSDYLISYTMIDRDQLLPISVGIQRLIIGAGSVYQAALSQFSGLFAAEAANAAMLLVATLPVIVVYALLQKWFMKGLMEGAIKS
jgi:multiple sugar transport system permease protein